MKKNIIKRRKRVVGPQNGSFNSIHQATPPPNQNHANSASAVESASSALQQLARHIPGAVTGGDDDTEMADSGTTPGSGSRRFENSQSSTSAFNPRAYPPPIDFTASFRSHQSSISAAGNPNTNAPMATMTGSSAYRLEESTLAPLQLNQSHISSDTNSLPTTLSQKRSLSMSAGDTMEDGSMNNQRLHSISSILNPHSKSDMDVPIEPSLLALGASGVVGEHHRIFTLREKRARLEREQKRLKEELEECDRELSTLAPTDSAGVAPSSNGTMSDATMMIKDLNVITTMGGGGRVEDGGGDGGAGPGGEGSVASVNVPSTNEAKSEDAMVLTQ